MLECLADLPWPTELLRFPLQIAARHVEANGVAIDGGQRSIDRKVSAALLQSYHQLDLMVHVRGSGRVGEYAVEHEIVGILLKEERSLAVRVVAHLHSVRRVVPANAIDAVDRKHLGRA